MKILTPILCLFFLAQADAAIYKWVDAAGNTHFSDQPQEGATEVELREPTVFPGMKPPESETRRAPAEGAKETKGQADETPEYTRLTITSPANDVNIWAGDGNVEVDVDLEPRLRAGHRLVLKFNGTPVDRPFERGRVRLENVDRGSHRLTAEVHDQGGAAVARSETILFHLSRPAIKIKKQPRPAN